MSETLNLTFRGYAKGKCRFTETDAVKIDRRRLGEFARQYCLRIAGFYPWMLEIELLDEPDPLKRFFRLGSDRARMKKPIRLAGRAFPVQTWAFPFVDPEPPIGHGG